MNRIGEDWVAGEAASRMRARSSELFVEVQRADGKAAALCGLTGGLLAAGIAALSNWGNAAWPAKASLVVACGLLVSALVAALAALRPSFPRHPRSAMEGPARGGCAQALVTSVVAMSSEERLHADAVQVTRLGALAHRKFRAIKVAVDLIMPALFMAGIGLLIAYMTS
ncbi:Pycsar system effector family protein [Streptomyces xiamenensis]